MSHVESPKSAKKKKLETLLCAAVGTASHYYGLTECTMYGKCKTVLENDKAVLDLIGNKSASKIS
jgi:predicted RNase H-like nuclease